MEKLQQIPIPFSQRWKEFRIKFLPGVIFLIITGVVINLWNERIDQANMTGKVVGTMAELRSSQAGYLTQLQADRFQYVAAGETLTRVITTDPDVLEARLAVILAEVEMIRLGMGPLVNRQRNVLNYENMQMDLMKQRIELASADIYKQRIEREYNRINQLYRDNLVSEDEYERVKSELDVINLQVTQKQEMLETMQRRMDNLNPEEFADDLTSGNPIAAAIRLQEEKLRLVEAELMPVTLKAPIDGMISHVYRRGGEQVNSGEPILAIHSPDPEYILGYMMQPLKLNPEPGMKVIVRAQGSREEFEAEVLSVGTHLEEIGSFFNTPRDFIQSGLPVKISLAEGFNLRPGELVDLTLITR